MITKLSRSVRSWLATVAIGAFSLGISALGDTLRLHWEASPDSSVTQYRIYGSPNATSRFDPELTTRAVEASITHPGPLAGYRFYVTALNAQGVESDPSNFVEVGPRLGYDWLGDRRYSVSWDEAGFVLQSAPTVRGPWTLRATTSPFEIDLTGPAQFFRLSRY